MATSLTFPASAYAAQTTGAVLAPLTIERRAFGADDVHIDIEFCGVCHSDVHMVNNDWGMSFYPLVPGHEIIGRVRAVGSAVKHFKVGQRVGVGCLVDSCRICDACQDHLEQYCCNGFTLTYGSPTKDPGGFTYGGYSKHIVVDHRYVVSVPEHLNPAGAAPLLCAGITTYSPLAHWGVKKGMTVGIIGLGGLGHMGVKFAHAMGAHVVMVTTSEQKGADAKRLGADDVLISTDANAMAQWAGKFDFLLNTIPVPHDMNPYVALLKRDATMCVVGALGPTADLNTAPLVLGRRNIAGSLIGGIKETQDMLNFAGAHNITADVEIIDIASINEAYKRMQRNDIKYRFVIDIATLT
jgi:alcohol dehydrogenase (NADP+)